MIYIGEKYGRFTVLSRDPEKKLKWICECSCENRTIKSVWHTGLANGTTLSCGCLRRELAPTRAKVKHGHAGKSSEYTAWGNMKGRCLDTKNREYPNYGGRGIKICERWLAFENFIADLGLKPTPEHSLDRIDVNGPYEPGNVKWSSRKEQNNNKRDTRYVMFKGVETPIQYVVAELGMPRSTLQMRLDRGWSIEEALYTPRQKRRTVR